MYQINNLDKKGRFWETEKDNKIIVLKIENYSNEATKIKNLNQAIHNISMGIELTSILDDFSIKLKSILSKVKKLISSTSSNLRGAKDPLLSTKISLNLSEFDQTSEHCLFKGHKLLNGTLSISKKPNEHFYIPAGKYEFLNLNKTLNIHPINAKVLGLEIIPIQAKQNRLKHFLNLEKAYNDINQLQQKNSSLGCNLQHNKLKLLTTIENHRAAINAPNSYELANEVIQLTSDYKKINKLLSHNLQSRPELP